MSKASGKPKVTAGTLKTASRLMKYVTGPYKVQFIIVLICILMTSISSISVSLSLRFLLDDFILPLVGQTDPKFFGTVQGHGGAGMYFHPGRYRQLRVQPDDGCQSDRAC